jgi:MFS family permease
VGAIVFGGYFPSLLVAAFIVGGLSNPLYSLLIAYTNDFLTHDAMPAAASGLVFINGLGAVAGPLTTAWMMSVMGPSGFFLYIAVLGAATSAYAGYRMTKRRSAVIDPVENYTMVLPSSSPMAVTFAQEYDVDVAQEDGAEDVARTGAS